MKTRDKWHPGTLLTLTLQKVEGRVAPEKPAHLVVLGRIVRQDENGAFLSFLPVLGQRRTTAVRPASKKEIAHFLTAHCAGV